MIRFYFIEVDIVYNFSQSLSSVSSRRPAPPAPSGDYTSMEVLKYEKQLLEQQVYGHLKVCLNGVFRAYMHAG